MIRLVTLQEKYSKNGDYDKRGGKAYARDDQNDIAALLFGRRRSVSRGAVTVTKTLSRGQRLGLWISRSSVVSRLEGLTILSSCTWIAAGHRCSWKTLLWIGLITVWWQG